MLVLRRLFCNWEESDMVEWKKITSVSNILYGFPFDSSLFTEDENYIPLIRIRDVKPAKASTYYTGSILADYIIKKGDILVGMDGEFNLEKWNDRDGLLNQRVLKIQAKEEICLNGYIYHYMGPVFKEIEKRVAGGVVKHLSAKIVNSIQIPIPSKSEQERIVSILDTFTSSISNLKEQIKERRKQYEYYRDQLLDLEGKDGVEMKSLGEVCDVKNGYTPSTKNADFWEEGNIPWFTLEDIRKSGRILSDAVKHITPLGVKKNGLFPKDSIIVSTTATIGEHALILVDFMCNQQITCISINNKFKYNIGVKFLYYLGNTIGEWCRRNVNGGGGLSIVSTSKLKQYAIPIPSKEEQLRIVSILDQFEASIANLEAQLKEREKQYEYYRNQLLTFE